MKGLIARSTFPITNTVPILYLTESQVNFLTSVFQEWYDTSPTKGKRKSRGRYWLTFLVLRYTGARVGEVLSIDDRVDIDFRNTEIRLITLKRHNSKTQTRIVPVQGNVTSEIATYVAEFPNRRGSVFKLDQSNFRHVFYERAKAANIPREMAHPHILRHTRAIELLRAGVPVTIVQDILGHSALTTTAIYLKMSGQEAKGILKDKGLI
ncbi:MAG: site-specific integrase [Deltaproteobacteria bacterium]|nr:site-specific integrase [Deltaproteobacteria bacterium]